MSKVKEFYKQQEILNSSEMAGILGVSEKTLLSWVATREIPVLRKNRVLRFQPQKVVEALNIRTKKEEEENG